MITKIGNALLEKEAGIPQMIGKGLGKAWDFAAKGLTGMKDLAAGAAKGAHSGVVNTVGKETMDAAGNIMTKAPTFGQKIRGGLTGMHSGMENAWKGIQGRGAATATAGMGMLGMGMLAGGDNSAPAPQYNFYQSGYPQQFSGSWQ